MLIKDNAYLILWLKSDETDLIINKRYHELEKLSKVWMNKSYPIDLSFVNYKKFRTLSNIKEAFHNLTDQNNRLYHFFFWFYLSDDKNLDIFNIYKDGYIVEALESRKTEYNKTNDLDYLMNYVLWALLAIELDNKSINLQLLEELALKIPLYIQKILWSTEFVTSFHKRYNESSTIKISKSKINDFIKALPQYICEQFFTLWEQRWTFFLYKWICELYNIASERVHSTEKVLNEYDEIDKNYSRLKYLHVPNDIRLISTSSNNIIKSLDELLSLWIKDNPKLWKLRDGIASLLLWFADDLYAIKLLDDELNFLSLAKRIAYSNRVMDKIILKIETTIKEKDKEIKNINDNSKDSDLWGSTIQKISSTATRQIFKTHVKINNIIGNQVFLKHDNNMIAKTMLEHEFQNIKTIIEKLLGKKIELIIEWNIWQEQKLDSNNNIKWWNGNSDTKSEENKKSDKIRDETNYLISSIYLSLDVIKRPLLLNNYSKLLEEISKVNDMIKKIEESNLVKEEYVIKIRDNIWEAILTAATQFYTEYWSYEKAFKLLQMAKKMARSRWILNKIIIEMNIMEESERKIKWEEKKSTTYVQSNVKNRDKTNTKENLKNDDKHNNWWKWFSNNGNTTFVSWSTNQSSTENRTQRSKANDQLIKKQNRQRKIEDIWDTIKGIFWIIWIIIIVGRWIVAIISSIIN